METTTGEVSCYSGADRLSLLPDEVLHHILSFVPETKEIARTSVLSARFRCLWQHHPTVRFDASVSVDARSPSYALDAERYLLSVRRCLLSLRSPTLQTLDLRLLRCTESAAEWVQFAASRSVRRLRLTRSYGMSPEIPAAVYSCRTLTSLELHGAVPACPDSFTGFPFLLHLEIDYGPISSETLARLLSNCPSLRSLALTLSCCDLDSLDISSGTLSDVSIHCFFSIMRVRLDIPNLSSITFRGEMDLLHIENARRLTDATMIPVMTSPGSPPRLIRDLRHVSGRLEVSDWLFGFALPGSLSPYPAFENLKELRCLMSRWVTAPLLRGLVSVLQHCPNLEQLYVSLEYHRAHNDDYIKGTGEEYRGHPEQLEAYQRELARDPERKVWDPLEAMEGFEDGRHSRLKFVVVKYFLGTANEMKMLEYLLSTGSALEKLTIGDCLMRGKEEIHQLLAHIPRASPQLQILHMDMSLRK